MTRRIGHTCRIGPQDFIRIIELVERDRDAAITKIRERDRAISIELGAVTAPEQVLGWSGARGGKELGATLFEYVRNGCFLAGAAIGLLAALAAFSYDGTSPINLFYILLWFVLLPFGTLVLFVWMAARDSTPMVNPGRFAHWIARFFHGEHHSVTRMLDGRHGQGISKWLTLLLSQYITLGYSIISTVTALVLIWFSDLAFAWGTTDELQSATKLVHLLHCVAAPWGWLIPAAVPDSNLVESSQYYRLHSAAQEAVDPVLLGRWWSFVIAAMTVYGVAPRLLALGICQFRLRIACACALDANVEIRALLDRMHEPLVDTRAGARDVHERGDIPSPAAAMDADASLPHAEAWTAVNWAGVPVCDDMLRRAFRDATRARVDGPEHAGGARSVAEESSLVAKLGERAAGVAIFAKAWEPPLLDLGDFVTDLCNRVDVAQPVVVVPVSVESSSVAVVSEDEFESWRRTLARNVPARVAIARLRGALSG